MRRKLTAILVLATALALAAPVAAITTGQPDENEHPYVGQLLFYVPDAVDSRFADPGSWFNCTGTLLNSTVIVTAGHCTFGVGLNGVSTTDGGKQTTAAEGGGGGNDIWIHFGEEANYEGLPRSANYIARRQSGPIRGSGRVARRPPANGWHRGTAHPHPQYDDNAFFLFDAGVVELDEPATSSPVMGSSRASTTSRSTVRPPGTSSGSKPSATVSRRSCQSASKVATRG